MTPCPLSQNKSRLFQQDDVKQHGSEKKRYFMPPQVQKGQLSNESKNKTNEKTRIHVSVQCLDQKERQEEEGRLQTLHRFPPSWLQTQTKQQEMTAAVCEQCVCVGITDLSGCVTEL